MSHPVWGAAFWTTIAAVFIYVLWGGRQAGGEPKWRLNSECMPVDQEAKRALDREGAAFWSEHLGMIDRVMRQPAGVRRMYESLDESAAQAQARLDSLYGQAPSQSRGTGDAYAEQARALRDQADAIEKDAQRAKRLAQVMSDSAAMGACRSVVMAKIEEAKAQ